MESSLAWPILLHAMDEWLLLGLTAGFLTTIGFVPQIIKSIQTKRMGEVSLLMPLLLSLGMFLWMLYGLIKEDAAIIFWNAMALSLNLGLFGLKVYFNHRRSPEN
jgi:MtN3 and saliva related transmembrane protein